MIELELRIAPPITPTPQTYKARLSQPFAAPNPPLTFKNHQAPAHCCGPIFMPSTNPYFRPNQPRLRHVESAISSCLESYFITLTTKRRLTPETFARELHETLNRVNSKLFGTAFKRGRD